MSGFFKKLFNRITGTPDAVAPPQEAAEVVEPVIEPEPPPPAVLAPVLEPIPTPLVLPRTVIEPSRVVLETRTIETRAEPVVLERRVLEPVRRVETPIAEVRTVVAPVVRQPEPPPPPEPAPIIAEVVVEQDLPVEAPKIPKKKTATEKLKSLWPFSRGKGQEEKPEPVAEPAPEPAVVIEVPEVEPPKPVPRAVVEPFAVEPAPPAPVTVARSKTATPKAKTPPPPPKPKRGKAETETVPTPKPSSTPIQITEVEAVEVRTKASLKKAVATPILVAPEPEPAKKGWLSRLKEGLSKSSKSITGQITTIFTKRKLDAGTLQELEDTLIQADLGITVSERIIARVSHGRFDKEIDPEEVKAILADEVAKVLRPVEVPFNFGAEKPFVILVVGVNGSGKTTTIGKLGAIASQENFKVKFAACDTFRAAAIEQLTVWGKRIGAETIWRPQGADAAGLAFDAMKACHADGTDILFIDTAGRLHNKTYLMDELDKVVRVIKKYDAAAPHAVLLVLDATTGQNALAQAEAFTKVAGVTGLIMTKLDGTARGGILVAIAEKFKLPIHAIGVGETLDDLQPFDAEAFSRAIAGLDEKSAA